MGRNNIVGAWGEAIAAQYLQKNRYKIIATGYRSRFGEIDLIVQNKKYLVFVEVKLRKSTDFGRPSEFVGYSKQEHLKKAAILYMKKTEYEGLCRFDVVEIVGEINEKGKLLAKEVNIIKDAF